VNGMTTTDRSTRARASGSDDGTPASSLLHPAGAPTPAPLRAPGLPAGVALRPYAGPEDHPGMVAAGNAWRTAMGFLELVTVASQDAFYANMANCDPRTDCVVAERDGAIAGYARVEWADARDGERTYGMTLIVAPCPDRPALIEALLDGAESRSIEIAAGQETDRPRVLDAFAPGKDAEFVEAYERRGYVAVRRGFEMVRPDLVGIPDVPLPHGLEIRPVLPEHMRAIYDASTEAFRDHWGGWDDSEERWQHFIADPLADASLWRVAWDGDQVAGQVRSYVDAETNARTGRLTGWTESISVRRPWRRRGLARALLADSLRAVRDRGMREAALHVDAGNETGALALYESLGFVVHRSEVIFHRPMPVAGAGVASAERGAEGAAEGGADR
jgi:mycothiol synthase